MDAGAGAKDAVGIGAPPLGPDASALVVDGGPRMLHTDRRRTNRAHGRGPAKPRVAWSVDVGGPVEAQVTTSPDETVLYVASLGGSLRAIARDGQVRWTLALGDRIYATPCVADDGTIYVGVDGGHFAAVTPDGAIAWKLDVDGDADVAPALTEGGTVVFAAGRTLYAVRRRGDVAWRYRAQGKIFTAPAITDDGTVVVGAQDHHVHAVTPAGALAWSVDLGADVDGSPVVGDDGAVYVGTDAGDVVRLGAGGAIAWRAPLGGFVRGALSLGRDGSVLAGVYGPSPREVRVAPDGRVLGAYAVPGTGAREFGVHGGALEDDDGTLYFGGQDDAVYAVARDGRLKWKFPTEGDVDAPMTLLSDGALVVSSDDGKVYLLAHEE